jgi:NADH dehydrogenase
LIPTSPKKQDIIIVGGGAGGGELAAALGRRFGRSAMNVTLIDCATSHLWKPRLHEVAAGLLGVGEDDTAYLAMGSANHFRFRLGALTHLDSQAKTISISAVKDSQGGDPPARGGRSPPPGDGSAGEASLNSSVVQAAGD